MDQTALKFIEDRQAVLRDAYETYKLQFPTKRRLWQATERSQHEDYDRNESRTAEKRYAWGEWSEKEVDRIVAEVWDVEARPQQQAALWLGVKDDIRTWIKEFLEDTGSMFRLYRKSGFDRDKAVLVLRETIGARIQQRRSLLWSPVRARADSLDALRKANRSTSRQSSQSRRLRADSDCSRTSAQSPRASPVRAIPEETELTDQLLRDTAEIASDGPTETLIQLYPCSSLDPNQRPLVVVSLKHLAEIDTTNEQTAKAPPKVQALAAFERLRNYLGNREREIERDGSNERVPLQFILIIDLAGGRVSTTAWDMVKWLVRDAADQFHGMCSAVFVVNYSWEFGAVWSFIKHVLPAPAKARVIFPTLNELENYLGQETLPPALGGTCTRPLAYYASPFVDLEQVEGGMRPVSAEHINGISYHSAANGVSPSVSPGYPVKPSHARRTSLKHLESTSHENPYYGYPSTIEEGVDAHGKPIRVQSSRRRKRDLIKTLAWLFLLRLNNRLGRMTHWVQEYVSSTLSRRRTRLLFIALLLVYLIAPTRFRTLRSGLADSLASIMS